MLIVWIGICVLLLAVEMHHLAFFAIFGALGAAAAAVIAVFAPHVIHLQVIVGVAAALVGVIAVRPYASKVFERRTSRLRIAGVHGGLVGARGMTLDEVGFDERGHVRLLGETWLAVADPGTTIPPEKPVVIVDVTGTTLTVRAVEESEHA